MVENEGKGPAYLIIETQALMEWQQFEIASRVLLRAIPITNKVELDDQQRFHVFRATLLLGVAAKFGRQPVQTESTRKLGMSISGAGRDLLQAAKDAVKSATVLTEWDWHKTIELCLLHATNAAERDFQETQIFFETVGMRQQPELANLFETDLDDISQTPGELLAHPLWPRADRPPRPTLVLEGKEVSFDAIENTSSLKSDFWRGWYQGFVDGRPVNWDLQKRIALEVTDAEWDAGPGVVSERINEIEADFLAKQTRLHETVELNRDTGLFRAVPAEVQNSAFISALLSRVEDCLDDALCGNNGLTPTSREVKTLKRTIEKYANDPQRMELDFTSVSVSLRRQIHDTGELATSEDNLALLEATEEGARGLRAYHPPIAEHRNRLAQQASSELKQEDLEFLEEARPLLVAISEGQMAEDFERDIPQLINDAITPLPNGAPPLPGADEATRVFYRTSNMAGLFKEMAEHGARIFDSPEVKAIRLVGVCGGVGGVLYGIVKIGLRIFGVL